MKPLLSTALAAAEAAADVHLRHFGTLVMEEALEKAKSDFVTRVDLEAQEAALDVIRTNHPDQRILAEEGDKGPDGPERFPEDGGPLWIVDPLDGTTNYLHHHPAFAASVGVWREDGGQVVMEAGAIVAPKTGDRWWAQRGDGAWKNGEPIQVSGIRALETALVGTGFPFKEPELVPRYLSQLGRVLSASGGVRRCGSAALDLCYLADGTLDGFWEEAYLSPWDIAAGLVILNEAGGIASRIGGGAFDLAPGSVLAANSPELLEDLGRLVLNG